MYILPPQVGHICCCFRVFYLAFLLILCHLPLSSLCRGLNNADLETIARFSLFRTENVAAYCYSIRDDARPVCEWKCFLRTTETINDDYGKIVGDNVLTAKM